jgi:hypothetical protein
MPWAPARVWWIGPLFFHANLSSMFPHRPPALSAEFDAEFAVKIPSAEAAAKAAPPEHHSQICPVCSRRLTGHRCKLVCAQCGYYMSCADYY